MSSLEAMMLMKRMDWKRQMKRIGRRFALALGGLAFLGAVAQAQERVYQVQGTSDDLENEVVIDLYMEPVTKFLDILATDPDSATDPERIRQDAEITDVPNIERTLLLKEGLVRPSGFNNFAEIIDAVSIGAQGVLEANLGYVVLAVYTDRVPRSTDSVSTETVQYYGTNSPGVFIFPTSIAPFTPTPSPTPTPIGPTPTPLPFGMVVEADVDPISGRPVDPEMDANDRLAILWNTYRVTAGATLTLFFDRDDTLDVYDSGGNFLQTIVAGGGTVLPFDVVIENNGVPEQDWGTIDLTSDPDFGPPPETGAIPADSFPTGEFEWDFSSIPVGRYHMYGVLRSPGMGTVVDYSTYQLDIRGNPRWPVLLGGGADDRFVHGVAVDDIVVSATELDVIAVAQSGMFRVFDHLGRSWVSYEMDLNVTVDTAPITADVDSDGVTEIILGTNQVNSDENPAFKERNALLVIDGEFRGKYRNLLEAGVVPDTNLLRQTGLLNAIYYLPPGHSVYSTPCVADIDADGILEVVYTSRPAAEGATSLVGAVSFSANPNVPPQVKASISVERLVKRSRVLVTELEVRAEVENTLNPDRIEFTNVSGETVDITNWSVVLYDRGSWPDPAVTIFINAAPDFTQRFTLAPQGIFTLKEGCKGGTFPNLCIQAKDVRGVVQPVNLNWAPRSTQIAVMLRDDKGNPIDFVTTGDRTVITSPISVPANQWAGAGVTFFETPNSSVQRVGVTDTNKREDWLTQSPITIGTLNAGLTLPFTQTASEFGTPAVGNIDSDPALEVVVGSDTGDVYGIELASYVIGEVPLLAPILDLDDPSLQQPTFLRTPALIDVDGDGIQEILVALSERDGAAGDRAQLHFLRGDGTPVIGSTTLLFESPKDYSSLSSPIAGRLFDVPGAPPVALFATRNALVGIDLTSGAQIFRKEFPNVGEAFASSSPTLGQAQPQAGSEAFEFFIGGGRETKGNLFGWYLDPSTKNLVEVTGMSEHMEPVLPGADRPGAILGAVEVADLDGNLQTDLLYTNEAGYVNRVEIPVQAKTTGDYLVPADFPWPAFKHDRLRTGSSSVNTVPVAPYRPGDVNRDGVIDENDIFTIAKMWSEPATSSKSDGLGGSKRADHRTGAPQRLLLRVLSGIRR